MRIHGHNKIGEEGGCGRPAAGDREQVHELGVEGLGAGGGTAGQHEGGPLIAVYDNLATRR